jgi:hypothetical protein
MNKATLSSPYSSVLNAQHIAIFISLTIHLGLILIFLMIPATKIMHQPQTIQIRFYNPSEFSTDSRKMSAAKFSKPDTIVLKDNIKAMALKPAHKDIPQETSVQKNSEIIIAEKTLSGRKACRNTKSEHGSHACKKRREPWYFSSKLLWHL